MVKQFLWTCSVPSKSYWANYRWYSENFRTGWEKSFFRLGWQGKIIEVNNITEAKEVWQTLNCGTITAYGGRFRGASYDKNAEIIVKQAIQSLKKSIKKYERGEDINIKEIAIVPSSRYNYGVIIGISGVIVIILFLFGTLVFKKRAKAKRK